MLYPVSKKSLALTLTLSLAGWALPAAAAAPDSAQTIKNLNAALNGERNAHAKYLAFAEQADEEGYGAVASLFRAAAAAEEVHGNNHEKAMRTLGGNPEVKVETPVVHSTRENLEAAISGETHEYKSMYPEFVNQARQGPFVPAIVTFEEAQRTEEVHAKLYQDALRDLDKLKGSGPRTYYVCSVCGYTVTELNFEKCPNCLKPKDRYNLRQLMKPLTARTPTERPRSNPSLNDDGRSCGYSSRVGFNPYLEIL
jgi:rubrerythrin